MPHFSASKYLGERGFMVPYLTLTDDGSSSSRSCRYRGAFRGERMIGPCAAAFLFRCASGISIESLPIGQFPRPVFLRSTQQEWLGDNTLRRLLEVGPPATARMEKTIR
jgi:hypothetical protein